MSDSYDDYECKIQLAEQAWEVKTEHDRAVELAKAYERGWNAALAQQEPMGRMNRDEIIRMAREAGISESHAQGMQGFLERFVTLVAAAEREACAELVWPTKQIKTWSEEELTAMTGAFNRAQEKHGWYETIMAVGAVALKGRAAAIRARGNT